MNEVSSVNEMASESIQDAPKQDPVQPVKKKGKRGKRVCPDCDEFVPIHSQRCWNCQHFFKLNHKPKKIKLPFLGEPKFTLDYVSFLP